MSSTSQSAGPWLSTYSLSRNNSPLVAFIAACVARLGKSRANLAVANKRERMVYFMPTRGEAFVDQGKQHYEELQRQRRIAAPPAPTALGFQRHLIDLAAVAA